MRATRWNSAAKNTPVYEGAEGPLMREVYRAEFFHGPDGMGDMNYPAPQSATRRRSRR